MREENTFFRIALARNIPWIMMIQLDRSATDEVVVKVWDDNPRLKR